MSLLRKTAVRITPPPDLPVPASKEREVIAQAMYEVVGNQTRLSELRDARGRLIVDLPVGTRFQLPSRTPVVGQLLVDDGVRVHRVSRLADQQ